MASGTFRFAFFCFELPQYAPNQPLPLSLFWLARRPKPVVFRAWPVSERERERLDLSPGPVVTSRLSSIRGGKIYTGILLALRFFSFASFIRRRHRRLTKSLSIYYPSLRRASRYVNDMCKQIDYLFIRFIHGSWYVDNTPVYNTIPGYIQGKYQREVEKIWHARLCWHAASFFFHHTDIWFISAVIFTIGRTIKPYLVERLSHGRRAGCLLTSRHSRLPIRDIRHLVLNLIKADTIGDEACSSLDLQYLWKLLAGINLIIIIRLNHLNH